LLKARPQRKVVQLSPSPAVVLYFSCYSQVKLYTHRLDFVLYIIGDNIVAIDSTEIFIKPWHYHKPF
jgi:hypothetical protein